MKIIECNSVQHASEMLGIFNEVILNSTALYEYEPRTVSTMDQWFAVRQAGSYPVIGLQDQAGELLGFASYGVFRNFPAYRYTVEHSVYVRADRRGRGLGEQLLRELIVRARMQNYHLMVGAIDVSNEASIRLHDRLEFSHAGTINQAGFKFGRWLDVAFYQLLLDSSPRSSQHR